MWSLGSLNRLQDSLNASVESLIEAKQHMFAQIVKASFGLLSSY
jgi:hypothetical protein